jgi:hypothetical protein
MADAVLQRAAVGQNEQALAVRVKTARGVNVGDRNEILQRAVLAARAELAGNPVRLVEQQQTTRLVNGPSAALTALSRFDRTPGA